MASAPKPKSRLTRLLENGALVLLSTVFAVAALEVGLRWSGYAGAHQRLVVAFDDRYGEIPKDSWPMTTSFEDPSAEVAIDGDPVRVEKPKGKTRVVFVGDSGTQGVHVPKGTAFPQRFHARLDDATRAKVEVVNLGVPGLSTIGELNLVKDRVLALSPDEIVLGVFMANDINMNLGQTRSVRRPAAVNWLRRNSALAHFVYLRVLAAGTSDAVGSLVDVSVTDKHGISLLSYVPGEFATYISPMSPTVKLAFEVTESALAELAELTKARRIGFSVVLLPTLSSLTGSLAFPGDTGEEAQLLDKLEPSERVDVMQPTRELLSACAALGIRCLDPTARLAERLGAKAILENDDHPSEAAHDLIAEALIWKFDRDALRFVR